MPTTLLKPWQPGGEDGEQTFCYAVTDIEADGPEPGRNSMLSFATVATDQVGTVIDTFEGRLLILEGATSDPDTLRWLQNQPAVWADATSNPKPPSLVMAAYVAWLRALPLQPVFVASPLAFDGIWIDWYLRRFTGHRLVCGPFAGERLFFGSGIDLHSLIMGVTGRGFADCRLECYPREWLGGHIHSHRAIDDALGYAHILKTVLELNGGDRKSSPARASAA
jgi:hypothetical protein